MKTPRQFSSAATSLCLASLSALSGVTGTPFANNPFTIDECAKSLLSHKSPAFGAIAPDLNEDSIVYGEIEYQLTIDGQEQQKLNFEVSASATANTRKLEASNTDLQSLESHFGTTLEMNVKNLTASAAYYVMPWPSSYWATYEDSINHRWSSSGDLSPAEKYATAFGLDLTVFMRAVSSSTGVQSQKDLRVCSSDRGCASLNDNSVCAIRLGEQQGYCIPKWFGLCHAWSPAALLEPEPKCAVQKNGVMFQPMDIKALLTQVYDGANISTVFTGARYYGSDDNPQTDQYGRFTDGSRRDLGPGFLHVALTNILGRFNSSVVMDVTGSSEVWNQPVYSYEVINQSELTPTEAASKYYGQPTYPFNNAAKRIMYTETKVTWMVEAYENGGLVSSGRAAQYTASDIYTYLLELDNDYNILGGEWVGKSKADHPDFLWVPKERPALTTVTDIGLSYQNVRELLDLATNCA
ncbi:hypothetical protein PHYBOEH_008987 [Phytophthora boehmeriae]|uniref:Uncharacterized protein n=1 Tax=Phytophthora boehmeriae TaxID=109152 RepID=A0A8T1W081_9STRA|nr:hypothetical protein PHYBOEH_008987 [Phytophthora boehmeriae]